MDAHDDVARQRVAAGEYLVDYIDKVLEAFHTGEGVLNNAPEPITLDIARRLIWREIRRVMLQLDRRELDARGEPCEVGAGNWWLGSFVWLRASRLEPNAAQALLTTLPTQRHWHVRGYGPRREGDPAVFYIVGGVVDHLEVAALMTALKAASFDVRDFTYNCG